MNSFGNKSSQRKLLTALMVGAVTIPFFQHVPYVQAQANTALIEGTVYVDKNENGKQDQGEKGLKGISVSDGIHITKTDSKGDYTLQVDPDKRLTDLVFITTPDGYKVPLNDYKVPQFYRELEGLQAGQEREVNFGLLKNSERNKSHFEFATITDVHVRDNSVNNREKFTDQILQLNELKDSADFLMVSGDLTHYGTDEEFQDFIAASSQSELPIYPAPGNHDITKGNDYKTRIDNYRKYMGPEWYSFDHGNKHFVILENHLGFEQEDQLNWLKEDLKLNAKNKQVIVVTHIQLNAPDTPENGTVDFLNVLKQYDTKLILSGHTHVNDISEEVIPGAKHVVTSTANSNTNDYSPAGYRLIDLSNDDISTQFKMFSMKEHISMIHPSPKSVVSQEKTEAVFNVFNTSSTVEKVEYRIGEGAWRKAKQNGEWTWTSQLDPSKLSEGEHQLEVRATDNNGNTWNQTSTFTVDNEYQTLDPELGTNWTMFKGNPYHSGVSADPLSPTLNLADVYQTDGAILTSSPAIVDQTVYIGVSDQNDVDHNYLLAYDPETGKEKWKFHTNAQIQGSPAYENGVVYAPSVKGTLYAVDAETGLKKWEKSIGIEKDGIQRGRMYASPNVSNGFVYQAYSVDHANEKGSYMMKLDANTGEVIWNKKMENDHFIAASPIIDEENGRLYTIAGSSYLYAMDLETGNIIWKKRPPLSSWSHSVPTYQDGKIYVGFRTGILVCLDAETGQTLWDYQSEDSLEGVGPYMPRQVTMSSPTVVEDSVYMGFPDGKVMSFNINNGTKKWEFQANHGIASSPVISGDTLYIGSYDGHVYGLNRHSGDQTWKFQIGAPVISTPAISGNSLIVGGYDGNLYTFTSGT
ncbi:PQQ-binding-like beta-propeller repeat protein [Niallia sp. Krafla_26]|uniref:outer membrane protein assembly factor BamB family protein n=1 Tax=Niallia sp. Krafla_26 TaxID=3064703 RepID=UPI003D186FA2